MKKVIFPIYRWGNWSLETLYNMHRVIHLVIMEPGFESGFLEYKTHAYNYCYAAVTVALFPILLDTFLVPDHQLWFPSLLPQLELTISSFLCVPMLSIYNSLLNSIFSTLLHLFDYLFYEQNHVIIFCSLYVVGNVWHIVGTY